MKALDNIIFSNEFRILEQNVIQMALKWLFVCQTIKKCPTYGDFAPNQKKCNAARPSKSLDTTGEAYSLIKNNKVLFKAVKVLSVSNSATSIINKKQKLFQIFTDDGRG